MFSKLSRLTLAIALLTASAIAQNFTAVSGSKTQDASGALLANGQICFIGTDQNDQIISYQVGGGGQAVKTAVCSSIIAGVITGFNVANPATTSPTGVNFRVTVVDNTTGQEVLRYKNVTFVGATFSFDNYVPIAGVMTPLTGTSVSGNLSGTGNASFTGSVQGSTVTATGALNGASAVIGGDSAMTAAPRMTWSVYLPSGNQSLASQPFASIKLDKAIVVTRIGGYIISAPTGCSTAPTFQVSDLTTSGTLTVANSTFTLDSGALSIAYPAGTTIYIRSGVVGIGCSNNTAPNIGITVEYRLS